MWYQPQYSNQMLMNTRPIVQLSNRWAWVKSYQDVQATPIPADGTPTLFMLENEPTFYLVSMENGQRVISGYRFAALTKDDIHEPPAAPAITLKTLNARLKAIEEQLRSDSNEPDTTDIETAAPTK